MIHFFLSYAHGDRDDDARVHRFFNDLSTEVRVLTGDDPGTVVGFHDDGMLRIGDDWPRRLVSALASAQTMVALCSPRYFRSEYCGKEWAAFSERVRRVAPDPPGRTRIIPVSWVRTALPQQLGHVHHRDAAFGQPYEERGLRQLLREGGLHYDRFVGALATRITGITCAGEPMRSLSPWPDLAAVPSAFRLQRHTASAPRQVGTATAGQPTEVPSGSDGSGGRPVERPVDRFRSRPILQLAPDTDDGGHGTAGDRDDERGQQP